MKLAGWSRSYGVHPNSAYRWSRDATMPVPAHKLPSGTIVVEQGPLGSSGGRAVACWRVSLWASERGLSVDVVVGELSASLDATEQPTKLRELFGTGRARVPPATISSG